MTALARLDALLNNALLNNEPKVAATLKLIRDDVAKLTGQAQLVPVAGSTWLDKVETALALINEAEGCLMTGRIDRGMDQLARGKKTLEDIVNDGPIAHS
jgi:hypothetical protein